MSGNTSDKELSDECPAWPTKDRLADRWGDYAQRTTCYAYSAAGDRQAEPLATYRQQRERLEGREPQWQHEQAKARTSKRENSPG
jgi:hypothetical protein